MICWTRLWNFYPRPPRGGRRGQALTVLLPHKNFYPRPPRGGRRRGSENNTGGNTYFYPRPPRGGRLLLAVDDAILQCDFYPRPPRGGRQRRMPMIPLPDKFLSTPSARRATHKKFAIYQSMEFLSTPSARRATWSCSSAATAPSCISIHALREEGDFMTGSMSRSSTKFLSTPSARRATVRIHP